MPKATTSSSCFSAASSFHPPAAVVFVAAAAFVGGCCATGDVETPGYIVDGTVAELLGISATVPFTQPDPHGLLLTTRLTPCFVCWRCAASKSETMAVLATLPPYLVLAA